jgi:hypothetical protein
MKEENKTDVRLKSRLNVFISQPVGNFEKQGRVNDIDADWTNLTGFNYFSQHQGLT